MTKYVLALWCCFAALPCGAASATPACYESAQHPAHDFAFAPHKGFSEITAITPDGMGCETVRLYNGEPLLARKFYAPLRKVYEAYARAIDQADAGAAKKIYAYLRPTPRQFPQWVWLANEPEGPPEPWGMEMAERVLRLLQTDPSMRQEVAAQGDDPSVLDMSSAWLLLYLLMGGEVLPQEHPDAWVSTKNFKLKRFLLWHSPWAVIESIGRGGPIIYSSHDVRMR